MEIDPTDLYSLRLLMFLEIEPQSNQYRQVILNPREFKKVSMAFGKVVGELDGGRKKVEHTLSDDVYTLPDLQEIHYEKEI